MSAVVTITAPAIGSPCLYEPDGVGAALPCTVTGAPVRYAGKGPGDATPWVGVQVRFTAIGGLAVVPVECLSPDRD